MTTIRAMGALLCVTSIALIAAASGCDETPTETATGGSGAAATGGTGGTAGGEPSSSSSSGGQGGCKGGGGCASISEACGDDTSVETCAKPLLQGYCAAEGTAEMWTVSASDCTDVPNGYYYFASRQAGAAPSACPGWDACVMGAYGLSPPYVHTQGAGGASPPLPPEWTVGGGEECAGFPVACQGLPFGIVDDQHPTSDATCGYQCTAADPSASSGVASCTGPASEACSFTYAWERLVPWPED